MIALRSANRIAIRGVNCIAIRSATRIAIRAGAFVLAFGMAGCATVSQNRRAHLADPMMGVTDEPLDAYRRQKLYDTREGAAGGDGAAAGGGCGCQ